MARKMRAHPRTQVVPDGGRAGEVFGECIGLSRTPLRVPTCSVVTSENVTLLALVRASLPPELRRFGFSTAQLNRGLRPKVHCDNANLGISLTISLGPFAGGGLWQSTVMWPSRLARDTRQLPPWKWNIMDGAMPHGSYPFCGQRCSVVLFLHDVVLQPVPDEVASRAAALGLVSALDPASALMVGPSACARDAGTDWQMSDAVCEAGEAALTIATETFESLRERMGQDAPPRPSVGGCALPQPSIAFLLFACHVASLRASRPPLPTFGHSDDAPAWRPMDEAASLSSDVAGWRAGARLKDSRAAGLLMCHSRRGPVSGSARQAAGYDHWVRVGDAGTVDPLQCTTNRCDVGP